MHTEIYCPNLESLDKVQAIRAIHQAWIQLNATATAVHDCALDFGPSIQSLALCLKQAGHPAFVNMS